MLTMLNGVWCVIEPSCWRSWNETLLFLLSSCRCRNRKRCRHWQETPAERQEAPESPNRREPVKNTLKTALQTHTHTHSEDKLRCVWAEFHSKKNLLLCLPVSLSISLLGCLPVFLSACLPVSPVIWKTLIYPGVGLRMYADDIVLLVAAGAWPQSLNAIPSYSGLLCPVGSFPLLKYLVLTSVRLIYSS